MSWVRLRQVALVAHDLDAVTAALHAELALEVAFNDPGVAEFGLRNAVIPVGNQFIEVVSPTRPGTAGGRQLERLGGDGGYMVICHTDDHEAVRRRVAEMSVRTVVDHDDHGYQIFQLHPADTGGSFLEIDFQPGGEDPAGPWMPAGPDWQRVRRTDVVQGIAGVEIQSRDPDDTVARWSLITGCPVKGHVLHLDNATVACAEGAVETLTGVHLVASDPARVGEQHTIAGVRFTLV